MAASSSNGAVVSRNTVRVIAESVGIAHLKDDVADALAPDIEYRLRDLVQEALKFAKHGRRETLTTEDINYALRLRNCEPLYGFAGNVEPRFCRALTPGVFYLEDPELNLADLLAEPMPPMPIEPSFTTHWLAINGVQPDIPQNPNADDIAAASKSRKRLRDDEEGRASGSGAAQVTPLAKHALTAEEQTWLERVTNAVQGYVMSDDGVIAPEKEKVRKRQELHPPTHPRLAHRRRRAWRVLRALIAAHGRHFAHLANGPCAQCRAATTIVTQAPSHTNAKICLHTFPLPTPHTPPSHPLPPCPWQLLASTLRGVANDPSTQPLSAHLCALVASEVNASLRCLPRLTAAMRLLGAMLRSLSLVVEPYLHQLMPAVLTCLVGKRLCASALENHWALRQTAAALVRAILLRFKDKYEDLQPRVCKTLLDALADPKKPLSTHYGALIGLNELGPLVVHSLLMPSLPSYLATLSHQLGPSHAASSAAASSAATSAAAAGAAAAAAGSAMEVDSEGGAATTKSAASHRAEAELTARRVEAMRVHGAALHICGTYFYRHGELFATGPPPSATEPAVPPAAAAAAAIAAAGSQAGKSLPPPPRNRKGSHGGGGGGGTGSGGGAGGSGGAGGASAREKLLPQIATSYDVLHAEFGPSLAPYTWHNDWLRADAPGLLHAVL